MPQSALDASFLRHQRQLIGVSAFQEIVDEHAGDGAYQRVAPLLDEAAELEDPTDA